MNNVIFSKVLKSANETLEGEFPVIIEVTKENNGYAVFLLGHPALGTTMLRYNLYDKMGLIEWAILEAKNHEHTIEAMALNETKTQV